MGFLSFKEFVNTNTNNNIDENEFHFEATDAYVNENNREDIDNLLYEYVCNYKDDATKELTLEGLWNYINDDNTLSENMKKSLGKYIDICEESIEDTLDE